ncbi:MAG: hypothetical protein Q8Q33_01550 [Chlamydiota bacterium]|nr:hypothetical protein [Chlamydiota bacterium]
MKIKSLIINIAIIGVLVCSAFTLRYKRFNDELEYKGFRAVQRYDRWRAIYEAYLGEKWYPMDEWKHKIDQNLERQEAKKKKMTPSALDPTKLSQEVIEMIHRP